MSLAPSSAIAPVKPPSIPFVDLKAQHRRLRPRIEARLGAVLEHCRFVLGPEVEELEAELARFAGSAHAIGTSSGTDALLIALLAEAIGAGAAVFVPALSFAATAGAVVAAGAEPVFVDVDPCTYNIDPRDLERRIAEVGAEGRLEPRAVIAVDLFGLPADYPALQRVAKRHGLFLLADAAQSFGASLDGVRVGRLAPATATSFYPTKPLACYGDGGALLTDDPERCARMRSIRVHGRGENERDIVRPGINGRLDTLQAAILLAKLEVFADELARRASLASLYDANLEDLVTVPARVPGTERSWAVYAILVDGRDAVREALAGDGIETMIYYPRPLSLEPAFERFGGGPGALPVSERLCERVLCLPMYPYMEPANARRICGAVARALG